MIVTKGAADPANFRHPVRHYPSARLGLEAFLSANPAVAEAGILLPAYIGWSPREGSGVLDPIERLSVPYGFYDLNYDLSINLESLQSQLQGTSFNVVLVIHYFGRTEPKIALVDEMVRQKGAILIEDLAHSLFSYALGTSAGRFGDLSLFSIHKMLPTKDGGMVLYRNEGLAERVPHSRHDVADGLWDYDLPAIAQKRRKLFRLLVDRLSASRPLRAHIDLFWRDLLSDAPQTLPVFLLRANRDQVYLEMNSKGFGVVSLYHTLVSALHGTPQAAWAAKRIINLPVHQDMTADSALEMVDAFEHLLLESDPEA